MELKFRKSIEEDVKTIMEIITSAQVSMKNYGIEQWQNGYPNFETIMKDIEDRVGYVLCDNNTIIATVAVSFDGEKTYENIFNGKWISSDKYAVIHRIAVNNKYKGLGIGSFFIKKIEKLCLDSMIHSIKIDTHKDNIPMQKLLEKNNFKYCGVIYLDDKSERIAFEKII